MERKNFLKSKTLFFVVFAVIFSIASAVFIVKAGTEHNVRGWLWGGTDDGSGIPTGVGWIATNNLNFPGTTNYGIFVPEGDNLVTGYLWSENIGWIDFQPSGPYPAGPNSGVRREGDKLVGWARILSIKDAGVNSGGWEGWIKLSGLAQDGSLYGVEIDPTTSKFSGYAWSDELGWIDFSRSNIMFPPTCDFSANPTQIILPQKSTLSWQCQNANSCNIEPGIGSVNNINGAKDVSPTSTTEYILACSNANGSSLRSVTVTVLKSGLREVPPY